MQKRVYSKAGGSSRRYNSQPVRRNVRNVPPAYRRRRKQKHYGRYLALLLSVLLLIAVASAFIIKTSRERAVSNTVNAVSDVFCPGISINGIDIGDKTWDDALGELNSVASQRLDAVYTFTYEDQEWTFTPSQVGASLNIEDLAALAWNYGHEGTTAERYTAILQLEQTPISYESTLSYQEDLIDAFVESIRSEIDLEPVNAEVFVDSSSPQIVRESSNGRKLDTVSLRDTITDLVVNGTGNTELIVETLYPDLSTEDAASGLSKLVRYRTDTSTRGADSLSNVRLALSKFNGLIVYPGDTINFNQLVGERTEANGFKEAPEYAGNRTTNGIGGGVCQACTTMYGAMLKAGMTILERSPHTMTVNYVDPSLDAAVSDTGKNLIFRNDRDSNIYIYTDVTSEYATVYVYGEKTPYRIELESHIRSTRETYEEIMLDYNAAYVTYEDERVTVSEGKLGCDSEGYIVYYDWDTGSEVERKLLSKDSYYPSPRIIYVGISKRIGLYTNY